MSQFVIFNISAVWYVWFDTKKKKIMQQVFFVNMSHLALEDDITLIKEGY